MAGRGVAGARAAGAVEVAAAAVVVVVVVVVVAVVVWADLEHLVAAPIDVFPTLYNMFLCLRNLSMAYDGRKQLFVYGIQCIQVV